MSEKDDEASFYFDVCDDLLSQIPPEPLLDNGNDATTSVHTMELLKHHRSASNTITTLPLLKRPFRCM